MSEPAIPNTVEEFLALCRDETGVEVAVRCESCGTTWVLILPSVPDLPPVVHCSSHVEDDR